MKKIFALILSFACLLSAAAFAACNDGGDSGGGSSQEACKHSFSDKTFACTDRVCLICGEKVKATESHSYRAVAKVAPTCVDSGYTLNKCDCGATMKNSTVKALGHDFGEYEETVKATCTTVGVQTRTCSRCEERDNAYIEALAHALTLIEEKSATCTENGYKKYHCSLCEEDIYQDYVRATGHTSDAVSEKTVLPTCEEDGYDEFKCSVCQETYYENVIKAAGHAWTETGCKTCGMDVKALWLTEKTEYPSTVKYTNEKGWKVSAIGNKNYAFQLSKDVLASQIAGGATKVTLVFGGAFDGVDYGDGNPVNCKMNVVPKNVIGEDVWDYAAKFISGFTDNKDGTYSVEINLTNESFLFSEGIFFYVEYADVNGAPIGACYIHDIIFS